MPYGVDYAEPELRLAKAIADEFRNRGIFTIQGVLNMTYGTDYGDPERRQAIALADIFSSYKIGSIQPWTKVSPIGSNWTNVGGGFSELAYTTEGNNLRIRGTIQEGTNGNLFTLPIGFRPSTSEIVPAMAFNPVTGLASAAYIGIFSTTGVVNINTTASGFVGIQAIVALT
ncbi:MAG TPA: hypothetical protein V6D33_11760 [Cyanophyceae cyanobacterium]